MWSLSTKKKDKQNLDNISTDEEPNEDSLESLQQSIEMEKQKPRFKNSKELFNYMNI